MAAQCPTVGYHKIRGLGAPLRMMCYYKEKSFINVGYGADMKEKWFGGKKPELAKQNSCINLPYIIDGDLTITQSNTCLLYLGEKFCIDSPAHSIKNHTVLDQTMDLRNDLMNVVYPFGPAKTQEEFPDVAKKHMESSAKTNFTKLEGFCEGPYMCGASPQSGDFHVFEMLDQHESICAKLNVSSIMEGYPKLKALHAAMKDESTLKKYFASDCYAKWSQNNALFTFFTGQGDDFEYGPTVEEKVSFDEAPHMTYMPFSGRGELIRLIAAAGGVSLTETAELAAGESKAMYMSPSGLPILRHGDMKLSQSGAIESYISEIAPKFSGLSKQQRATDMQCAAIKEDILAACAKAMFVTQKEDVAKAKEDITTAFDTWCGILEARVPADGFVQGLGFPTVADLALLDVTTGYMPFGAAKKLAGYDFSKFPKLLALCDRAAKAEGVAVYLASTPTTDANAYGM